MWRAGRRHLWLVGEPIQIHSGKPGIEGATSGPTRSPSRVVRPRLALALGLSSARRGAHMEELIKDATRWGLSPAVEIDEDNRQRVSLLGGRLALERMRYEWEASADTWPDMWILLDRDTHQSQTILPGFPRHWMRKLSIYFVQARR